MSSHPKSKAKFHCSSHGNLIGGKFQTATDPNGELEIRSPADFGDLLGKIFYSYRAIDEAVGAASAAFPSWSRKSTSDRATYFNKLSTAISRRTDEIAEILARETGTPLWEAQKEISDTLSLIESLPGDGLKLFSNFKDHCRFKPKGVFAVISSFCSPILKPCSHLLSALLTGNTVVFKPSEKAPFTGQLLAECIQEMGIPLGVFNLLQGEREIGRRLSTHEGVHGILFSGSFESGVRIKQDTLQQYWKFAALEMGGKNSALVWEDADIDHAAFEILTGTFVSAGQRSTSTSRILVHKNKFEEFKSLLHSHSKAFSIDHPLSNPLMGPLIDSSAVDRYMKFLGIATREGCETVMRGKSLDLGLRGNYVTPSICWVKNPSVLNARKSVFQQTELLAPCVALICVSDLDEAVALANATQYGLVASVFSKNRGIFETCLDKFEYGSIHWNKSTLHHSTHLSYVGLKKSGNHFASGLMTLLNCVNPVASIEAHGIPQTNSEHFPGLNWKTN